MLSFYVIQETVLSSYWKLLDVNSDGNVSTKEFDEGFFGDKSDPNIKEKADVSFLDGSWDIYTGKYTRNCYIYFT